jgi:hypothetical protein
MYKKRNKIYPKKEPKTTIFRSKSDDDLKNMIYDERATSSDTLLSENEQKPLFDCCNIM